MLTPQLPVFCTPYIMHNNVQVLLWDKRHNQFIFCMIVLCLLMRRCQCSHPCYIRISHAL